MPLLCILIVACSQQPTITLSNTQESTMNDITLKTQDGMLLKATHAEAVSETGIILLHQLNQDRHSYDALLPLLKNYNTIAIDLRGHGESQGDWNSFGDEDFRAMELDVDAAKEQLKATGSTKFIVIGASIGANTAINYGANNEDVIGVIPLSPGLEYKGINTEHHITAYKNNLLIIVSEEDSYSYESSQLLHDASPAQKELKVYKDSGHGTNMFPTTDLKEYLVSWIDKNTQ